MSRSESILSRICRGYQRLSAAAANRTKSNRSATPSKIRPPRSRSLRFEPLESRELLSLTAPLTDETATVWGVAPEIVAPSALVPETVDVALSTPESAATQEARASATSDASLACEYIGGKYYNSHDLAVVERVAGDSGYYGVLSSSEYDDNDVARLRAFLAQNENGAKVSENYDADDPATFGVEWEPVDGVFCLREIDWADLDLTGALDLSECVKLKKLRFEE